MNNEEKILAMLIEMKADIADVKATQAEQSERLRKIEMTQETRVLPSLRVLAEGHGDLLKQLANKESVAEVRSIANLALSGVRDHTTKISDLTDRVDALEKAN